MNALYREYRSRGLTLVLVDMVEDREQVDRTVKERGYIAPVLLDADGSVSRAYGVRATPTVFVIGQDSTVLGAAIGPRPWAEPAGRALLQALLRHSNSIR